MDEAGQIDRNVDDPMQLDSRLSADYQNCPCVSSRTPAIKGTGQVNVSAITEAEPDIDDQAVNYGSYGRKPVRRLDLM